MTLADRKVELAVAHQRGRLSSRPVQDRGNEMARLLSVNVGRPRDIVWKGRTVHTGIWTDPVPGRSRVDRLNVEGDGQGDLAGHGGEQRAVFVYGGRDLSSRFKGGFRFGCLRYAGTPKSVGQFGVGARELGPTWVQNGPDTG